MTADFLLYGSYGYTGRLIVERARAEQAAETGYPHRAFTLDDTAALNDALRQTGVVLHAATASKTAISPVMSR